MGYKISRGKFKELFAKIFESNDVFAPVRKKGKGIYSDTDLITYDKVKSFDEIVFDEKTTYSPKEIVYPIRETLFYFTENGVQEPKVSEKGLVIFARACDINSFRALNAIFLQNGPFEDPYYKRLRKKVKFILMSCSGFSSCYCVSIGTNTTDNYSAYLKVSEEEVYCKVQDETWQEVWAEYGEEWKVEPEFVTKNEDPLKVPEDIAEAIFKDEMWLEYTRRCTGCGRCTVVCPTCTCFSMQDIVYEDNAQCGERRRVWASCQTDDFAEMAGGHGYRQEQGDRMRFKVFHKISDFKKRFGFQMCVGCGRCEDSCAEYISLRKCVQKIDQIMQEVK